LRAVDTQYRIGVGVCGATETGVALIVERTVLETKMTDKRPDLSVVPIDNGMNSDEVRPSSIRTIEMRQLGAMRVRTTSPNKNRLHSRIQRQIILKTRPQCRPRRIRRILDN